ILYHPNYVYFSGIKDNKASLYRTPDCVTNFSEIFSLASTGSRFNGIVNHPTSTSDIYLYGGGVFESKFYNLYRSTNNGNGWSSVANVGNHTYFIKDISISTISDSTIFYLLLENNQLYRMIGSPPGTQIMSNVTTIGSDYRTDSVLYVGNSGGLYRSTNLGNSFVQVLNKNIKKIVTVPVNNSLIHTIVLYSSGTNDTIIVIKDSKRTYSFLRLLTGNLSQRVKNIYRSSVDPVLYAETDAGIFKIDLPHKTTCFEPSNNANLSTNSITFRWSTVVGADSFYIEISTSSNFSSTLYKNCIVDTFITASLPLKYWQRYYWRIGAKNSFYNRVTYSDVFSFYYQPQGGGCPFVYIWNGNEYIEDNNILPQSEYLTNLKETDFVVDYYQLFRRPEVINNTYKLRVAEYEQERSILDQFKLFVVDHDPDVNISVTESGEIIQYAKPASIVEAQLEKEDVQKYMSELDNNFVDADAEETLYLTFDSPLDLNEKGLLINAILRPIPPDPPEKKLIAGRIMQNIEGKMVNTSEFRLRRNPSYLWLPITGGNSKVNSFEIGITWNQAVSIDYTELSNRMELPYTKTECELLLAEHSVLGEVTQFLEESDKGAVELYPGQHIDLIFFAPSLEEGKRRSFVFVSNGRYDRIEDEKSLIALKKQKSEQVKELPKDYSLSQNRPNPFNPVTTINYALPEPGFVTLKIYDVLGREVATLVSEYKEAGYYEVSWDATNVPSGIYIYRLQAGNFTSVKKMVVMK
ncbi:MAG: T9SS type A sorting domain-containing protein, partial [bacterium]|nr:T9SS type A sorting domain-containing protein [bacterium]